MRIFMLLSAIFATFCYASFDYYRLPRSIRPQHYNLRILTHLEDAANLFFTGEVEIKLSIIQSTSNITLHAGSRLNIATSGTYLQQVNCNKYFKIINVERNSKYDFHIIHLDKQLRQGHQYLLRIQFWARLERTMSGYYVSSYQDNAHNSSQIKFMSVTQFEPADARAAFPCFDEPDLKATFNISLGHPCQYNALSNMPIIEKIAMCERKNWAWSIFKQTAVMSTYLVAYSINDFEGRVSYKNQRHRGLKFTTWARASAIEQCKYAADIGPRILAYYEKMFDIKYPLPKMDQLAVPDFSAGAMENWGLITYRESSLFYAEEASSQNDKQHVANIVAHELAHQWFGNLVTMEWWNDLWLNEGFATYIATLGMEQLCSNWHAYDEESLDNVLAVLSTDAYYNTRPIHQPLVCRTSQISELFDSITYRKGAVIIRMMHMFIGDEAFRKGINCYLMQHAYDNARQEHLWQALTEAAHQCGSMPQYLNVQTVMHTWTLQKGIPLITVERHYVLNTATVRQMRFVLLDDCFNLKPEQQLNLDYCWFVPLTYATESQANFMDTKPRAWLRCSEQLATLPFELQHLPGEDEWLILNVQLTTPYRVNYDITNWQLIIKCLQSSDFQRIHVVNRAQLIDDSLALAWSGHLGYKVVLELLAYLKQEHGYMPWRAALDQLNAIDRIMRQTSEYKEFKLFMLHLLDPIYCHLEGMQEDTESRHHVPHKILINRWACRLDQLDCVKRALEYYHRWLMSKNPDDTNPVPQNLRSVVYCTAMRHGNADDWDFLWQRYHNTTVASEQRQMLLALGCSHNVGQIERYLRLAFNKKSPIRKQVASQIFGSIMRNNVGFQIAKDFVMHKFELLQQFYSPNTRELVGLLIQIAQHTSSAVDYHKLRVFITGHQELQQSSGRSLRRALEQVELNLRWRRQKLSTFMNEILTCAD